MKGYTGEILPQMKERGIRWAIHNLYDSNGEVFACWVIKLKEGVVL